MMTYSEILAYYADLLIVQYRNKPRAYAEVIALARESLIDNLPLLVRDAFDPANAVGVQLDMIGKYANVSRNVLTFTGGQTLNDKDFRTLIFLALARNLSQATLKDIDDLLVQFFGNALIAFDNANMTMGYFFNASFGSRALAEAFIKLDLLPRPMGVQLSSLIYGGDLVNAFGFRTYDAPAFEVSGFQTYDVYDTTAGDLPWLTYDDVVTL